VGSEAEKMALRDERLSSARSRQIDIGMTTDPIEIL
jgi:hypothetical protein